MNRKLDIKRTDASTTHGACHRHGWFFQFALRDLSALTLLNFTLTIAFVLLLAAMICDFRTREIPDWIAIAIAIVALIASCAGWLGIGLPWVGAGGVVGLMIGYALFRFAKLGGGDAKLIASLGMLLGPIGILILLFGMAAFGGVLSLIAMLRGQRDYAYVPAITAGFVWYVGVVSLV